MVPCVPVTEKTFSPVPALRVLVQPNSLVNCWRRFWSDRPGVWVDGFGFSELVTVNQYAARIRRDRLMAAAVAQDQPFGM